MKAGHYLPSHKQISNPGMSKEYNVPFATVFGNHNDQPYHVDPLLWNRVFLHSTDIDSVPYGTTSQMVIPHNNLAYKVGY